MIVEVKIVTTGQRIKSAREQTGMTQIELANKLNISYQSIGQWERDIRTPKQSTLIKIAKALGVHLRDLADTSIWEEFDKVSESKKLSEKVEHLEATAAYCKDLGYTVDEQVIKWHWEDEKESDPSKRVQIVDEVEYTLTQDGHRAKFTQAEFEELQAGAKEAIEGRFYKKVLEQHKQK